MRKLLAAVLLLTSPLLAQQGPIPDAIRLVMPHGKGGILIRTAGWKLDTVRLVGNGTRPILQMSNPTTRVIASYILDNAPGYYETSEACKNDVLSGVMKDSLANSSVSRKQDTVRILPNGQVLSVGSYFVSKFGGMESKEQVLFGSFAQDHTCAWVHLSRQPSTPGDNSSFEEPLKAFSYDPDYVPTAADYQAMAALLPPVMASAYRPAPAGRSGQVSAEPSNSLTLALPDHPGYLHMDAPSFKTTEFSAKPNGQEYGIRAKDSTLTNTEVLAFLFLSQPAQPTGAACRDWMLKEERKGGDGYDPKVSTLELHKREMKSESGVPIAIAEYKRSQQDSPSNHVMRAFVASGDLCADIKITGPTAVALLAADVVLNSLEFDPARAPDFRAKFRYATVLSEHQTFAAAAPVYESALAMVDTTDEPLKWRRIVTDQASMAYGMAGDTKRSRALNEAAVRKDPDYPLYYYNLACADAEDGDAKAARGHLQQAFDRRAHTIASEGMPDPTTDGSFLKLKTNPEFWAFVQSLAKK